MNNPDQDPMPGVDDDFTRGIASAPILVSGAGIILKQFTSLNDIGDALITAGTAVGIFNAIYHSVNYIKGAYAEIGNRPFVVNMIPTLLTIVGRLMY